MLEQRDRKPDGQGLLSQIHHQNLISQLVALRSTLRTTIPTSEYVHAPGDYYMVISTIANPMPAKVPRVAVYMPPEVKAQVEALAAKERRSLSQMVVLLLERELERRAAEGEANG